MRYISEYVQHEVFVADGLDSRRNAVESWDPPVPLGIYAFDPGSSSESGQSSSSGHEARVITAPTLLVPSSSEVAARDRVTVRGTTYEVDGEALDYRNPYDSAMNGKSIKLKAVEG